MAAAISRALDAVPESEGGVRRSVREALDAVADGMPAEYVGRLLYAALATTQPLA